MSKFKLIKKITKKWTSGLTTFSVISDGEHSDRNYIILDRSLLGRPEKKQFFNLHLGDWSRLKGLIEDDLKGDHKWPTKEISADKMNLLENIGNVLEKDPDFIIKILSCNNLSNLTQASFEALDQLGLKIYQIKKGNIEFILKKLSESTEEELAEFTAILEQLRIGQVSTMAELIQKKISIIVLLEKLMKDVKTKEREIHLLLENNLWLLSNDYDLVRSDKSLADYLDKNIKIDPDLGKRPDLIIKNFLQDEKHIILVELKKPSVKLKAEHIGQILSYKGIIQNHNPQIHTIDLYLLGYDVDANMPKDLKDLEINVLENVVNKKRKEYDEFLKILEDSKENNYEIF